MSKPKNSEYLTVLNLIDFDGTLYYNPRGNLGTDINRERIIPYTYFPICRKSKEKDITNILFSGRHISQLEIIIFAVESRGYHMNNYLLNPAPKNTNPFFNPKAKISSFFVDYWNWKLGIIERYVKVFDIVNVIDDDEIVCRLGKVRGANVFLSKLVLENNHLIINLKHL